MTCFPLRFPRFRPLFLLGGGLGLAVSLLAQDRPQIVNPVSREERESARTLLIEGDLEEAETVIRSMNADSDPAQVEVHSAMRFAHLASQLARSGNVESVRPVIERALRILDDAEDKADRPELKASARALAGQLTLRYLGDAAAAKAHFEAASSYTPDDKRLKTRIERLERAEDAVRERVRQPGAKG